MESRIEVALSGLPGWRSEIRGGILRFKNEVQGLVLIVKRLPFGKTALSGEIRLDGPTGRSILNLAIDKGISDEALIGYFERLGFNREPVMALLTKLLPVLRDFLLLEMPEV